MAVTNPTTLVQSCPVGGAVSMNFWEAPWPLKGGLEATSVMLGQSGSGWPETAGEKQTWDPKGVLGGLGPGLAAGGAIPIAMGSAPTGKGVR